MSNTRFDAFYPNGDSFWLKIIARYAKMVSERGLMAALTLYYAAQEPTTPAWARAAVYVALAYLIMPLDAIPDMIPGIGLVDDAGVLVFAVGRIVMSINDEVKAKARRKYRDWFGIDPQE